jgi:hypothetical protein
LRLKLFLSSITADSILLLLKDLPLHTRYTASRIEVFPEPFLPKKKLAPDERSILRESKHLKFDRVIELNATI